MARQPKARQQIEAVLNMASDGNRGVTAYDVARVTGYSPQHCNRILAVMWHEGLVAYRPEDRKHQLMSPRLWSWAGVILSKKLQDNWFIHPSRLAQMELPL